MMTVYIVMENDPVLGVRALAVYKSKLNAEAHAESVIGFVEEMELED